MRIVENKRNLLFIGGRVKVGGKIIPYPYNKEFIVKKVFFNKDNELSYIGKFVEGNKTYEFVVNSKDKFIKEGTLI
jgi:hypothetical protein